MVRTTIDLGDVGSLNWHALREEETFLYRAVADKDRAVLAVGVHEMTDRPLVNESGFVGDWYFGHRCYESGLPLAPGSERHVGGLATQQWWIPRWVFEWKEGRAYVHMLKGDEANGLAFANVLTSTFAPRSVRSIAGWRQGTDKETYLDSVAVLLKHIQRGDIYEVNYCTERHAFVDGWDPFDAFDRLLRRTRAPFAAFHRSGGDFALCASPERFLAFEGRRVIGQPMKGTRPRSADPEEDLRLISELRLDAKERSENIMALDVMRNDLSRVAASRSVAVEDLCAVRTYAAVHQMISTVKAELMDGVGPMEAMDAAFPMASMTGAPKIRAMQLIDAMETGPRGLFSGTLGFLAPDGTADFNVVIRTVLYDAEVQRVSLTTGSAITATCDPEREWEECELKARSIIDALGNA